MDGNSLLGIAFGFGNLAQFSTILFLAAVGAGPLFWARQKADGTTLRSPATWALCSWVALAGVEALIVILRAERSPQVGAPLRYTAAIATLCPAIALLGAKRPQDRAWQLIVVTLFVLLVQPVVEWRMFQPDGSFDLHPARRWFLAIAWSVGWLNYLPTRFGPTALLAAAGQSALLAPLLPVDVWHLAPQERVVVGLLLIGGALGLSVLLARRPTAAKTALDRAWIDFRNAWGAFWALRIMERVRASAGAHGWNQELSWIGLVPREPSASDVDISPPPAESDELVALLGRFVSPEWIGRRMGGDVSPPADAHEPPTR